MLTSVLVVKRILPPLFVLALVAVACGGTSEEQPRSTSGTESPVSTVAQDSNTTATQAADDTTATTAAAPSEPSAPRAEGPNAPDFTLALDAGGEFVLSQEVKPVYMVFWAEW